MQGPELTYTILAESQNAAAVDVLIRALSDASKKTRYHAVGALLRRPEARCGTEILAHWDNLDADCHQLLRQQKNGSCRH